MSAIPPPPPQPASKIPATLSGRPQVIVEPSPRTASLPVGSSLKGHVLAAAPKGFVSIQTDAGVLVGKSALALAEGMDVTLLLQARTPRLHLQITSVNGQKPRPAQSLSTARAVPSEAVTVTVRSAGTLAASPSAPAPTPPSLSAGSTVQVTLLRPAEPPAALPLGSQFPARVIATHAPAAGPNGANVAMAGPIGGSQALTPGQIFTGNIMTPARRPTPALGTAIGTFALDAVSALPRGSVITLEIVGSPVLPAPQSAAAEMPSAGRWNAASAPWPALGSALETVQGTNPTAAQHVMDGVLPGFNAGLTSRTLFFLRALGRGRIADWLGEAPTKALRAADPALLSRLSDEFRQMGRTAGEKGTDDWRVVHLPLSSGTAIEPVRLLMRRGGGERKGAGRAEPDARFVVEMTLSHLGRIQFDALVREDGKRLDLMVRSDAPLPAAVLANIRALFAQSSEIAGLRGEVGFQASPPEFVDTTVELSASSRSATIV